MKLRLALLLATLSLLRPSRPSSKRYDRPRSLKPTRLPYPPSRTRRIPASSRLRWTQLISTVGFSTFASEFQSPNLEG